MIADTPLIGHLRDINPIAWSRYPVLWECSWCAGYRVITDEYSRRKFPCPKCAALKHQRGRT